MNGLVVPQSCPSQMVDFYGHPIISNVWYSGADRYRRVEGFLTMAMRSRFLDRRPVLVGLVFLGDA